MKRKIKVLGPALVAALAMSVVAAGTAGAEGQASFTADAFPAVVTGHEEGPTGSNYFQVTGPAGPVIHCEDVTYEGTLNEKSTSLTVTPHYTNCEKQILRLAMSPPRST